MKVLGRYKNGNANVVILDDGTKIRQTKDNEFVFDHSENIDIKICDRCSVGCPMCHEGSTPDGKLADIMNAKFIDPLHAYQEVALGGGNVLEHPDLIPFLHKLKDLKVITNITLNQIHFEQNEKLVKQLIDQELIYGLGISLVNPTLEFIEKVKKYPNAVIHVINGMFTPKNYLALRNNDLKILILGFKQIRRGTDYFTEHEDAVVENQNWLKENLEEVNNGFNVVSFDNLAIEQLDVKRLMTDEEWGEFFMGDDGTSTFYIDMVEEKFAKSSTAPFDKRFPLVDNVDDMFLFIKILNENFDDKNIDYQSICTGDNNEMFVLPKNPDKLIEFYYEEPDMKVEKIGDCYFSIVGKASFEWVMEHISDEVKKIMIDQVKKAYLRGEKINLKNIELISKLQ